MFKATVAAAFLLVVGYVTYLASDTLIWFVTEAAALALLAVRVCGGTLVGLAAVGALWLLLRQQYERDRQRDGAFALREYWLEPLPKRAWNWICGRPSARAVYDHNANIAPAAIIHNNVYIAEPPAGWDRQLAYAQDIERTNRTRAAIPGDGVLGLPWWAGAGKNGVANAATGRMLAGAYDKPIKPVTIDALTVPQLPAPMVEPLTPAEAVQESQPARLVMGQTDSGELVLWDMTQTPHLRLHGMTRGSGKTNVAQTLLTGAIANGAHGVVFDPANLKDWGDFAHCAELVDASDPRTLADGAARLMTIYHNRTRQLAKAGVRDVSQMARPPKRIIVVIAEFGAQCELARAEGVIADVETPLLQLARKAASTGIHLVLEDQVVEKWPRGMAGNAVPVIGRMPAYAGQACGFQNRGRVTTETFAPFQFAFEGRMFRAPHMQPSLRTLLAAVPAPQQLVMLTPPWRVGEDSVPQAPGTAVGGEFSPVPDRSTSGTERNAGTPAEDAPGRWDDVVAAWFAANPQALTGPALGISDLARAMCRDNEGGSEANYGAYKGRAHPLFHAFRDNVRLPNGAKLGVDITGGTA